MKSIRGATARLRAHPKPFLAIGAGIALALTATAAGAAPTASARPDTGVVLKGDQPGTVFRTLTVEGEDRVHLEIARPALKLDLDPADAPGLDLGSARDVLDRTRPDLVGPLLAMVAADPSDRTGHPWLDDLATGPVARFRPDMSDVSSWQLTVTDSRGHTTATFEGKGNPPKEIDWSGYADDGSAALPGLTYSYVLEARDRAGNRRHFMGEGFEVPAYRVQSPDGPIMVLPAPALTGRRTGLVPGASGTAALEVATWLDQEPLDRRIEIAVVARTHDQAAAIAHEAHAQIAAALLGDPARVRERLIVEPEAPERGAVIVTAAPAR